MVRTNISISLITALSAVGAAVIGYAIRNDEHQDWKVQSDDVTMTVMGVAVERSRSVLSGTHDYMQDALSQWQWQWQWRSRDRNSITSSDCKESVDLDQFPQWREEVGYWIGELSLNGQDGTPHKSPDWNYPYGSYKGFITGNIKG